MIFSQSLLNYLVDTKNLTPQNNPNSKSRFCKTSFFPNLNQSTVKAINTYVGKNNLSEFFSASGPEIQDYLNIVLNIS